MSRCNLSRIFGVITAAAAAAAIGAAPASAQLAVSQFTIDGGGSTGASGGAFTLGGTIAQPDAGRSTGGSFALSGGFWAAGSVVTAAPEGGAGNGTDDGTTPPDAVPLSFRLLPARPNPLDDHLFIAFELPEPAVVSVELYDAAGRLVRSMAGNAFPAGRNQWTWDRRDQRGDRVSAGVYFIQLSAGAHHSRQKVVAVF
jgi:hypothetical protein